MTDDAVAQRAASSLESTKERAGSPDALFLFAL
jgi:hypothetical protein